jgi:hypothetical protein
LQVEDWNLGYGQRLCGIHTLHRKHA